MKLRQLHLKKTALFLSQKNVVYHTENYKMMCKNQVIYRCELNIHLNSIQTSKPHLIQPVIPLIRMHT